jgi:hypothetical protein
MENLQVWKTIQYAAENQGTDGERSLRGHAYQPDGINPAYQRCCSDEREKGIPRQKVLRHSLLSHHVPWVHEDHRPQLFCFLYITGKFKNKASSKLERERESNLKHWKKLGRVQIPIVHVAADLHASQTQRLVASARNS